MIPSAHLSIGEVTIFPGGSLSKRINDVIRNWMTIPKTKKTEKKEDALDKLSLRIKREVGGKLYIRLRLPSYSDSRSWRTFLGSWLAWDSID